MGNLKVRQAGTSMLGRLKNEDLKDKWMFGLLLEKLLSYVLEGCLIVITIAPTMANNKIIEVKISQIELLLYMISPILVICVDCVRLPSHSLEVTYNAFSELL